MKGSSTWALAALACGLLASGCESVMWYGRSPDRAHAARVVAGGGAQRVVVGGAPHPAFDAIAMETIAFDRHGRIAYAARHHGGWSVVVDGRVATPPRPRVAWVGWASAPDTVLAVVGDARGDGVVAIDVASGRLAETAEGPLFDAVAAGSVVSTRDGHVGFVGFRGGAAYVVVRGAVGPAYDGIARLQLSPEGEPSYLGRRAGAAWVVRRGVPGGPHLDAADLVASPGGQRSVALLRSAEGWHADDGEDRSPPYDSIGDLRVTPGTVAYRASREGTHWVIARGRALGPFLGVRPGSLRVGGREGERVVFAARDVHGERVVVDGARERAWSEVTELALGDDGAVAYLARDGAVYHLVRGAVPGAPFAAARDLRLGAGGHTVFVARVDGREVVVDGASHHAVPGMVPGTLRLAPDGASWGALAAGADGLELVASGGRRVSLDLEELVGELLRRRDTGAYDEVVGAWLDAELARMGPRVAARR